MTPSATQAAGERTKRWTREAVIEKIREWHARYGEVPRAADWNPSSAKWSGAPWRAERYRAGDWPSLNAAKAPFDGRFTDAIVAAGFEPTRPGPPRRTDVAPVLDDDRIVMDPRARVALEAANARVRDLEATVETRDRQLARAYEVNERARTYVPVSQRDPSERPAAPAPARTITKTKVVTRRVADPETDRRLKRAERTIARLERDVDAQRIVAAAAALALKDERAAATRAASKLERAEATINTLRGDKRELAREAKGIADQAGALEREVERLRAREPEVKVIESANDAEVSAATAALSRAEAEAHDADVRAARAERELREVAALVTGEQRRLTPTEVDELRRRGPAGERVLAGALRKLATARAAGGKEPLREALTLIAAAAITWRERL